MRVVPDTNVLVSAFLWAGRPLEVIEFGSSGKIRLYTSDELLAELAGVLSRPQFSMRIQRAGGLFSPGGLFHRYKLGSAGRARSRSLAAG